MSFFPGIVKIFILFTYQKTTFTCIILILRKVIDFNNVIRKVIEILLFGGKRGLLD